MTGDARKAEDVLDWLVDVDDDQIAEAANTVACEYYRQGTELLELRAECERLRAETAAVPDPGFPIVDRCYCGDQPDDQVATPHQRGSDECRAEWADEVDQYPDYVQRWALGTVDPGEAYRLAGYGRVDDQ